MNTKFHGIIPAIPTPMTSDEEIDIKTLAQFVEWLIAEGGVHGLVPLGSTGEFYALTPDEREQVLKTTLSAAAGRVPVIAGINSGATRDVVGFAKQAEKLGAAGVLIAAPYYSLPTHEELFEHFRAVNDAIGLPIILYNYPDRTGVDLTPDFLERLATLPNVQYIKESTGDLERQREIKKRCGDAITLICGGDTIVLESFELGAAGWITGAANFIPKECVTLFELATEQKDLQRASELSTRLLPILAKLENEGKYSQYVKAACEIVGHPVGPPRRPLLPATSEEVACLRKVL